MINHLYIDNFRCFTNFEWKPGMLALLLGDNGSGKSSIFDVVEILRDFVNRGTPSHDKKAFPVHTLTAWDKRPEQTFELGIAGNGGQYLYRLVIEHVVEQEINRIKHEQLKYDDIVLYHYENLEAHLFRDDGSVGPVFPTNWSKSLIATIPERRENQRLTWFRKYLEQVYVLSPVPSAMMEKSEREDIFPDRQLPNYVSWLRYLSNDLAFPNRLVEQLREVLDGFESMQFKPISETAKALQFMFDYSDGNGPKNKQAFPVRFDRLSDGQRCLAALYTGLLVAEETECSFLWDEPDNYVSLREIQPWLTGVRDLAEEKGRQCILISHHPELINTLAVENGALIYRDTGGPSRVKPFVTDTKGMSPAEVVACGWEE